VLLLAINLLVTNLWEEAAWAGLVQTRWERRHNLLVASLLTAVIFALGHLTLALFDEVTVASLAVSFLLYLTLGVLVRPLFALVLRGTGAACSSSPCCTASSTGRTTPTGSPPPSSRGGQRRRHARRGRRTHRDPHRGDPAAAAAARPGVDSRAKVDSSSELVAQARESGTAVTGTGGVLSGLHRGC
jgi:Type II CAAX prenyl endopeptidase Rce1-like